MTAFPTQLAIEDKSLLIEWSDGESQSIKIGDMRKRCPCAHCREERASSEDSTPQTGGLNVLSPAQTQPLTISKMEPVGNYAYSIQFSDGHSSGIFPFEFLRSIND